VILTPIEPSKIGGIERLVTEFANRLAHHYDLRIVCSGESEKAYENGPLKVSVVKGYTSLHIAPKIRKVVEDQKPALIYVHNYNTFMPYVAWRIKKTSKKTKVVLHAHYHPVATTRLKKFIKWVYDPLIGSKVVQESDEIIANSQSELNEIKTKFQILNHSAVLYNGIDLEKISSTPPMEIEPKNIPLLWVGRFEPYKNPFLALEVLKNLDQEYHLYFIGSGPLESEIRSAILRQGIEERAHVIGRVSDADLYQWYRSAHCFLHFSSFESFGMTCIEALAAGTPVVANEDGYGLSETIHLFPDYIKSCNIKQDTPKEIAKLVINTSQMKPVSVNLEQFSWNHISTQLEDLLDRVLAS